MLLVMKALLMTAGVSSGQPSSPCRDTGFRYFVSDMQQCDRFHMCDERGDLAAEFLCDDGLVFDTISQQCGLPFRVGCEQSGRLQLQQPDPVGEHGW